jgi:hypothetical protein
MIGAVAVTTGAHSADPSTLPRLTAESFQYIGGFRLPRETVNGDSFSFGGRPIAFSPKTNSLYVGSRAGRVAEVSIPNPVISANPTALPFATYLQPFADPTEGHLSQVATSGVAIDGLMVYGDRLYGTASIYYDASNTQRVSHYSRSLQLNQLSFSGWSQVWDAGKSGFVSGFMSLVPAEWQARLGGPAATGQCCIPIVTRTSWGPAALAFDPARIGQAAVPASPLVYYSGEHPTLGAWSGSNPTYGATIQIGGMAIIAGTRTAIFAGRNGIGPYCYGNGTSTQSLHGTVGPDGAHWCYDPTSGDKGQHAYPYRYQFWAYDLNDFAAVKAGQKQPWEVTPYGVWPFDLPTPEAGVKLGGIAYDAERQMLYLSQMGADKDGYASRPIVHAMQIDVVSRTTAAALPLPTPVATTAEVTIAASKAAPQAPGTAITFTATPSSGIAPHQYKWWTYDGVTWTPAGDWTTANQFTWTPTTVNPNYRIGVWARSSGSARDAGETTNSIAFATAGGGPTSGPVSTVSIVANRVAPQAPGTPITWTATPTGGVAPLQYKWWVYDGKTWIVIGNWSASNTFSWTPGTANAGFRIAVWVKGATNGKDEMEASVAVPFAIAGNAVGTVPPPAAPPVATTKVNTVVIGADKIAPQPLGTTITWTAVASGGTAPLLYKWWTFDGDTWIAAGGWTPSRTFTWKPTPNANYRVGVWVKSNGNARDEQETSTSEPYLITGPTGPGGKAGQVALTTNRQAPLAAGSSVVWTATPAGGVAPHQYKWWVYNGSTWIVLKEWSTSNTYTWTPSTANPNYRIGVWVRSAGATKDEMEVSNALPFRIDP